jgi:hypothetical protein
MIAVRMPAFWCDRLRLDGAFDRRRWARRRSGRAVSEWIACRRTQLHRGGAVAQPVGLRVDLFSRRFGDGGWTPNGRRRRARRRDLIGRHGNPGRKDAASGKPERLECRARHHVSFDTSTGPNWPPNLCYYFPCVPQVAPKASAIPFKTINILSLSSPPATRLPVFQGRR